MSQVMEIRFYVEKEARKALVKAVGEILSVKPVYMGAPSLAFAVGDYIIGRYGTLEFDGQTDLEDVRRLLAELEARGYVGEGSIEAPAAEPMEGEGQPADVKHLPVDTVESANDEDSTVPASAPSEASALGSLRSVVDEQGGKLTIEVPFSGFTSTALENLDRLVSGKAWLVMKAVGTKTLPIERTDSALRFPWFPACASAVEVDAYARLVHALCELAKKQKRVTLKEKPIDESASEKFAFRCFLLRLGFIGTAYTSARKVLLSKLSGNGSYKSGDHRSRAAPAPNEPVTAYNGGTIANDGDDGTGGAITHDEVSAAVSGVDGYSDSTDVDAVIVVPERCAECPHHCYVSGGEGEVRSDGGKIVDTSNREPQKYTHYCVGTPSGFRRLKHAVDWSGGESPPKWCPLRSTVAAGSIEEGGIADE